MTDNTPSFDAEGNAVVVYHPDLLRIATDLDHVNDMVDALVARDNISFQHLVNTVDWMRAVLKGLLDEVDQLAKAADR